MSGKSVAKNSIYNVLYKGFTALFPLLTTAYISRVLLADGVGKVAYANTVVSYFVTIAALGIPNYGVKLIASQGDNNEKRSCAFYELIIINSISTFICLIAYYFIVNFCGYFESKLPLLNVMGIMLFLNFFNIDWLYQGIEEYGYITSRSVIIKIISFIMMLAFVKNVDDYIIYAIILCLATAGNYFWNFINSKKYIVFVKVAQLDIKKHIKPVLILFASSVATEIYTMLDTIMLEYYHGDAVVGYYTNSVKIVRMVYTVTVAMVATFYPRISSYYANNEKGKANELLSVGLKIILVIGIPAVIGLIGTSKYIVNILLGETFLPSVLILNILSVLVLVFSIAYLLGHVVLMSTGNENVIFIATLIGAFTNAVINFLLIPRYGAVGAAAASVTAEIAVTIVMLIRSSFMFKLNLNKKFVLSIIVSTLIMTVVLVVTTNIVYSQTLNLIIIILSCLMSYSMSLTITKNELALEVINKIKKLILSFRN